MSTFEQKMDQADRLRDTIVGNIAAAIPVDADARQRLTKLRASLDQIGDATMYDLASLDQNFHGSLAGGVADEITRIARGRPTASFLAISSADSARQRRSYIHPPPRASAAGATPRSPTAPICPTACRSQWPS